MARKLLTGEDKDRIRALVASGVTRAEVARREHLAESTIGRVVRGFSSYFTLKKSVGRGRLSWGFGWGGCSGWGRMWW